MDNRIFGLDGWQVLLLCGGWLLYGGVHSLTASLWLKRRVARRWPQWMPFYRLLFNLFALFSLLPLLVLLYLWQGPYLWQWRGFSGVVADSLGLLAVVGFVWSLRYYDGSEFLGLRQWRSAERRVEDQEHLHISPLHRFVRHPWYFLGLVILWTRDMDGVMFLSSLMISGYFLLGSRFEERKLLVYHGERYRYYRTRVPGLIPRPWRFLRRREAERLMQDGGNCEPPGKKPL